MDYDSGSDSERDLESQEAYDLINRAKDNVKNYHDNTSEYQDEAMDDTKFMNGDPWTDGAKATRGNRPMPVINDAPAYKRKVKKNYKNNPCAIKVTPVDNETDPKIARTFQGIVDQIMRDSMGDAAMDKAFDSMLDAGMGFCYVDTEYEHPKSFDQNLIVIPIKDKFSVFIDTDYKRMNMLDMEYGGFLFTTARDAYETKYPEAAGEGFPNTSEHFLTLDNNIVTLCRYYERSYREDTLISFVSPVDGKQVNALVSELDEVKYSDVRAAYEIEDLYEHLKDTKRIIGKRSVEVPEINWYILNDTEILAQGEWAGKFIPIIPTLGEEYKLEGHYYWSSLIRWTKDAARLYNYHVGNIAEVLALQPLTPAIGMAGQFNGHEGGWSAVNNEPQPFLEYNPIKLPDGTWTTQAPIPVQPSQIPAGNVTAAQMADTDKKNTMGIQDEAMGMEGRSESGKAILARSNESMDNVSVFTEQRRLATHYLGLVLVDLIPKYYDSARTQRILGVDGSDEMVRINDEGAEDYLNIKDSQFDIYIDEGPTFASQRKEDQATYMTLAEAMPQYLPAFADKVVENLDGKDAKEVTERVQKLMDPKFFVEEGEQTPEQLQTQIAQLEQEKEQLTLQNQEMEEVIIGEQQKVQSAEKIAQMKEQGSTNREVIKAESSIQKETMSNQTDIKESEIQANSRLEVEMLKQSMGEMKGQLDIIVSKLTA
jgi:hypothetical protein